MAHGSNWWPGPAPRGCSEGEGEGEEGVGGGCGGGGAPRAWAEPPMGHEPLTINNRLIS